MWIVLPEPHSENLRLNLSCATLHCMHIVPAPFSWRYQRMNKSKKVQVLVWRNQLYFPTVHLLDFVDNSAGNEVEGLEEVQKQTWNWPINREGDNSWAYPRSIDSRNNLLTSPIMVRGDKPHEIIYFIEWSFFIQVTCFRYLEILNQISMLFMWWTFS